MAMGRKDGCLADGSGAAEIFTQLDWMAKPIAPIATASFFGIAGKMSFE